MRIVKRWMRLRLWFTVTAGLAALFAGSSASEFLANAPPWIADAPRRFQIVLIAHTLGRARLLLVNSRHQPACTRRHISIGVPGNYGFPVYIVARFARRAFRSAETANAKMRAKRAGWHAKRARRRLSSREASAIDGKSGNGPFETPLLSHRWESS